LSGATLTILEKRKREMPLQRNNRQRWIHPHIYDWPFQSIESDRARLPILDWEAGYAETVARQISKQWCEIAVEKRIDRRFNVDGVTLSRAGDSTRLEWREPGKASPDGSGRPYPVIILAVGFGLERRNDSEWSYWEEDEIDAGLRPGKPHKYWLIDGCGDSALTDLMRFIGSSSEGDLNGRCKRSSARCGTLRRRCGPRGRILPRITAGRCAGPSHTFHLARPCPPTSGAAMSISESSRRA
jgi:hypothetical protein